jgi:hypothetical protein
MTPLRQQIESAGSWSVEYRGCAYDDARKIDGIWYHRDLITGEYRPFQEQSGVVRRFENQAVRQAGT